VTPGDPSTDRVVLTGGAGFIGSHVADWLLAEETKLVVIDDLSSGVASNVPHGVELFRLDLASPEAQVAIADLHPTVVIHCAAQTSVPASVADPVRDARSNAIGSLNVFLASRVAGARQVVYVTTGGALYGDSDAAAHTEHDQIAPASPYGISKWMAELYLGVIGAAPTATVLRLANVYGPRQAARGEAGVIATFVSRMRDGLSVVVDGDGEQTRDMLYVDDAVAAIKAAMDRERSGAFNIGTGVGTSVNTLFSLIARLTGYSLPRQAGPARTGDIRHSVLDASLAKAQLGWQARTSLEAGLAETVAWWRAER
jgi:UDP-glucose 4-epimerase